MTEHPAAPGPQPAPDPDRVRADLAELRAGRIDDPAHPRHRLALALRRLVGLTLTGAFDDDEDAAGLAAALEHLIEGVQPARASRYEPEHLAPPGAGFRPNGNGTHPYLGILNPLAPPLRFAFDGAAVWSDVRFDERHEGIPGLAQGGIVAGCFDVVLARAGAVTGRGGPTGTLSVRFDAPTPLHETLRFRGWPTAIDGRKVLVAGDLCRADGTVTASATGVMVRTRSGDVPGADRS